MGNRQFFMRDNGFQSLSDSNSSADLQVGWAADVLVGMLKTAG